MNNSRSKVIHCIKVHALCQNYLIDTGDEVILVDTGLPAGTKFEDLPDDWRCPRCKRKKEKFDAL